MPREYFDILSPQDDTSEERNRAWQELNTKLLFLTEQAFSPVIDGTDSLILKGDGTVWADLSFSVASLTRGASAPDFIHLGSSNIEVVAFDGAATVEEVSGVVELQHWWAEGTRLNPHLHWYPIDSNSGNVKWQLDYILLDVGNVAGSGTTLVKAIAAKGAWQHHYADFDWITTTGYKIGSQLHFRLYRDPTDTQDTYGSDAATATFGIHLQVNGLGSRSRLTK